MSRIAINDPAISTTSGNIQAVWLLPADAWFPVGRVVNCHTDLRETGHFWAARNITPSQGELGEL
jgi:hypothetical protein